MASPHTTANWDALLILDACRYDYFAERYQSFLRGELSRIESPGTGTPEFLTRTFTEPMPDVVYVSANPFVAGDGSTLDGFEPAALFHDVVDVWRDGKDATLGAAPPSAVNDAIVAAVTEYPDKRIIGHYIQPHIPFLDYGDLCDVSNFVLRDADGDGRLASFRNWLDNELKSRVGKGTVWQWKRLLGLPPATDMEVLLANGGVEELRRAYRRNLDAVLYAVHELLPALDADVIVTADHGELLGEGGDYGHGLGKEHRALSAVPWLEVDCEASRALSVEPPAVGAGAETEAATVPESVETHLRDLGYF